MERSGGVGIMKMAMGQLEVGVMLLRVQREVMRDRVELKCCDRSVTASTGIARKL